ncbi:MAG TPA: peptide chain release factor N(5)-glutamine methyltransferase [Sphingobacteriaceae bacterium]|nr:peptide chain release factor N(5)-glutamine methyltransferase [Sphingobacteriaceae bacterium]
MTLYEAEILIINSIKHWYDQDEAKTLAHLTICYVCKISKAQFLAKKKDMLTSTEEASVTEILNHLRTGRPLQYILGETIFYGLRLKVTPAVLIPRPETEELVDWIIKEIKNQDPRLRSKEPEVQSILDIGTGSGCIPIALKKHLPDYKVSALDISSEALEVARSNAISNKAEINFFLYDILNPDGFQSQIHNSTPGTPYSIIVSNPPYITHSEESNMHQNVLDHEPRIALFVPDEDALLFYNAIADFALENLTGNGLLFFEINEALAKETISLLLVKGFRNIILKADIQEKDRMIKAEL